MNTRFPPLCSEPFLYKRPHDLLRALCPAYEWQHLGVRLLSIAHPARTCACEHWKLPFSVFPLRELLCVLQKRYVTGERGVVDLREAEDLFAERTHAP